MFWPSEGNYLGIYRAEHLQVQSDSGGQVRTWSNIPLIHWSGEKRWALKFQGFKIDLDERCCWCRLFMGKIHLYHIIAWIFSEFFLNLLTFYSRDVWQMYLDKNEFELAKEYCRVRFDCKLSSLIDSFHLVDVPVFICQRILFKKSYQTSFSICVHVQKIAWQCLFFIENLCIK